MLINKLELISNASSVRRWSGKHMIYPSNVLEHTARVQYLTHLLLDEYQRKFKDEPFDYEVAYKATSYASEHDIMEVITNDVSYQVKKAYPELKRILDEVEESERKRNGLLDPDESVKLIVKMADIIDVTFEAIREVKLGNVQPDFTNIEATVAIMVNSVRNKIDPDVQSGINLNKLLDITEEIIKGIIHD